MATEVFTSFIQITDSNLEIVSGAEVSVYAVNSTTPLSVFSDTGLSVSAANPIICDSAGRADMRYIAAGSYKIVIRRTGAGATILTRDYIDGRIPIGSGALAIVNGGTGATSAPAALANLGGATAAELADVTAQVAAIAGTLASTEKTHIATGTTAQRPASPVEGDLRRNTSTSVLEIFGSVWETIVATVSGATAITGTFSVSGLSTLTGGVTTPAALLSSSATAGVGYKVGAGSTVVQGTNKTTGVTLNNVTGKITMAAGSIGNTAAVSFVLTNSAIAATDTLSFSHASAGTIGAYLFSGACAAGSATITVFNNTGGNLNEQIVIQFNLIKGAAS